MAADVPLHAGRVERRGRKAAGLRPPGEAVGGYGGWAAEGGREKRFRLAFIGGCFARDPNIFVGIFC
jgi:hypothetical protein